MKLTDKDLVDLKRLVEPIICSSGLNIINSWNKIQTIDYKDKRDVVTNVDIETENFIRKELSKIFPEAGFYVEEGESSTQTQYNWAIDPIDGTKYYASMLPLFVTQLALLEKGKPILGIVFNPISNQLFSAVRNGGTFLNGKKTKAVMRKNMDESMVEIDLGGNDGEIDNKIAIFDLLVKQFFRVRIFGGTVVSYLLTGAIDAYLILNKKNKLVDLAPNQIILQEAGLITDHIDVPGYRPVFCSANPILFNKIKALLGDKDL